MSSLNPNCFIHGANVLLLVAYSVRDVLWLRLFAVASALVAIPYFLPWDIETLNQYLGANPETRVAVQGHLVNDLAGKLHRAGIDLIAEAGRAQGDAAQGAKNSLIHNIRREHLWTQNMIV
jgi:hypothetical protein